MTSIPVSEETAGTLRRLKTAVSSGDPTAEYQGFFLSNTADQDVIGTLSAGAPASDDADGSVIGFLRRICKRLTSLIALLPAVLGQTTKAASLSVAIASDQVVDTKEKRAATGTATNVSAATSSTTVLASNANRLGATVFNDSTALLYLLLVTGGTASATAHTVQVTAGGYYEVPAGYTGAIIGIWASATGTARVTEFTA